jgi:acyl-CoA thioesterase FadM
MAPQAKFSVIVKPNYLDRYWSDDFIDYIHFARYARDAWLSYIREMGLEWPRGRVLMVLKSEHTYMSPLRIEEEVRVYARQTRMGRTSGTMEFQIDEAGTGRPVALLREAVVWVDRLTGRPVPIPDDWRQAIVRYEGKENVEVAAS